MKLFEAIQQLYSRELYDDVVLMYNTAADKTDSARNEVITLVAVADAYFELDGLQEAKRLYAAALQLFKALPKTISGKLPANFTETEVRFRFHKCLIRLKRFDEAEAILSKVPLAGAPLKVKYAIAKLRRLRGSSAATGYLEAASEVVSACPLSLSCQIDLIKHGKPVPPFPCADGGMTGFLEAMAIQSAKGPASAVKYFISLPHTLITPHILVEMGLMCNREGIRTEAKTHLWKAFQQNNDLTNGMDVLACLMSKDEESKDLNQLTVAMCNRNKDAVETYVSLACMARQCNQLERALQFAYKATTMGPVRPNAHAMILKASILADKEKYDEAVKHLTEVLMDDPQQMDAYEVLLGIYLSYDRMDKAQSLVEKVQLQCGDTPRVKVLKAMLLSKDGSNIKPKVEEAVLLLEDVIPECPYLHEGLFLLMELYKELGACERAITLINQLLESGALPPVHTSKLQMLLGEFHTQARRPTEAHGPFNKAIGQGVSEAFPKLNALNAHLLSQTVDTIQTTTPTPAAPSRRRRHHHSPASPTLTRLMFS